MGKIVYPPIQALAYIVPIVTGLCSSTGCDGGIEAVDAVDK